MRFRALAAAALACWLASAAQAQRAFDAFDLDHPAIRYHATAPDDPVAQLNTKLLQGGARLQFEGPSGYLRSLLGALGIPVESQLLVYSRTSLQAARIRPENPRAIYFNDSVVVAWVRGGFIEVASQDPKLGGMFYLLPQSFVPTPQLMRDPRCLGCHFSAAAQGVPGFFARSIPTAVDGAPMPWLGNATVDHRTPIAERWGGWYVTGAIERQSHFGNALILDRRAQELPKGGPAAALPSLEGRFPTDDYPSPHSDVVALLTFDHQLRMMNLLTRIGWEARAGSASLQDVARDVVDYMLFVDEVPLQGVRGSSRFAEVFAARGPRDRSGRSLREFDLQRRLFRYPCSYMIYSPAFDALPQHAKEAIYRSLAEVLSGRDRSSKYSRLSATDRRAIVEILRDTKRDLPEYF